MRCRACLAQVTRAPQGRGGGKVRGERLQSTGADDRAHPCGDVGTPRGDDVSERRGAFQSDREVPLKRSPEDLVGDTDNFVGPYRVSARNRVM